MVETLSKDDVNDNNDNEETNRTGLFKALLP